MNTAIILSGGIGTRMGADRPKQYIEVNGTPIIVYCLKAFLSTARIDAFIIGAAEEWRDYINSFIQKENTTTPFYYSEPGETRQYSIYNALKKAKEIGIRNNDVVIIHDAARPLVSKGLIERCIDGCNTSDAVLPIIPVKDTIYLSNDGKNIKSLLDRSQLYCGQAPEAFRLGPYLKVHDEMPREELLKINGSTEIAYKAGLCCQMVEGDPMNFKITTPEDLINFRNIIKSE